MKKILLIAALAVLALVVYSCTVKGPAGPSGANAVTAEFQYGVLPGDGYTQSYDAGIDTQYSNYSSGGDPIAWVGFEVSKYRTLIKFDVSAIAPSSVTVTSAYMNLYINDILGSVTVTAFPMTRSWAEGTELFNTTPNTFVSWLYYNGAGNAWLSGQEGGEHSTTAASNSLFISTDSKFVTFTLDKNIVQNWISNPSTNYGVILIESVESGADHWIKIITNEEATNTTFRPKLIVNYSL